MPKAWLERVNCSPMDTQWLLNIKKCHFDVMTSFWCWLDMCLLCGITGFYMIVVLLLLTVIFSLENSWYEIICNHPVEKNLFKGSKITSLLDSVLKLVPRVVCIFIWDKEKSWAQSWPTWSQQDRVAASKCCSIIIFKSWKFPLLLTKLLILLSSFSHIFWH